MRFTIIEEPFQVLRRGTRRSESASIAELRWTVESPPAERANGESYLNAPTWLVPTATRTPTMINSVPIPLAILRLVCSEKYLAYLALSFNRFHFGGITHPDTPTTTVATEIRYCCVI